MVYAGMAPWGPEGPRPLSFHSILLLPSFQPQSHLLFQDGCWPPVIIMPMFQD